MGRKIRGKRFRINVSLSAFVPKPHTPFQWESMVDVDSLDDKYRVVTSKIRYRDVKISWRPAELCMFDGWTSELNAELWASAMAEHGIDFDTVTNFTYRPDDALPWDHIQTGVTKRYLTEELARSRSEEFTSDCRDKCLACGVCGHVDTSH